MELNEIKKIIKNNPKYFSTKNKGKIEDIKSNKKYYFIGDCGHEFYSLPTNVFRDNKIKCPYCSSRKVLKGFNDMWTTNPILASNLLNFDDGYKYTENSNIKLKWKCPNCGNIIETSPNKMNQRKSLCNKCNPIGSYGEKFISSLLQQLNINHIKEKTFSWSNKKRYDFYLPEYKLIIEVMGKQHYTSSDFSYLQGRTYKEEQKNDKYKRELALQNDISYYIILDFQKSNMAYIKNEILNSKLPNILKFKETDINWEKCEQNSLNNDVKNICKKYMEGKTISELCDIFHYSKNSIRDKLKKGAILGWCNYNSDEQLKQAYIKNGERVTKTMSKEIIQLSLDNKYINSFNSIQEAQRQLNISHIWDCIVGKRNSAGGYKWKYKA